MGQGLACGCVVIGWLSVSAEVNTLAVRYLLAHSALPDGAIADSTWVNTFAESGTVDLWVELPGETSGREENTKPPLI